VGLERGYVKAVANTSGGATLSAVAAPTPAIAALVRARVEHRVHAYDHEPSVESYGDEAARAMGVEAGRVFKTLVVSTGSALVVAVVPVPAMLDMKALAAAIGAKRVEMADPAAAERSTGYLVGAISPIGQKRPLTTVLDESALEWGTIFCSAGRRGLEVELAPRALLEVTSGTAASIARAR
jgi:Cys-tRNA(Pro)/Cys-tRNA(Cys) deacylase